VLSGEVDLLFATAIVAKPQVSTGKFRCLAVTTPKRSSAFPDLAHNARSAPSAANRTANARPSPLDAPVIITRFPLSFIRWLPLVDPVSNEDIELIPAFSVAIRHENEL